MPTIAAFHAPCGPAHRRIIRSSTVAGIGVALPLPAMSSGLFHSANMHIIEKLTRVGSEIRYDMTIEDPDVFVEPWVMPTRILRAGGADPQIIPERSYCEVYELVDISTQLRH